MIEAKLRRVEWSDVDEDTFIRLCEYAYLRDYTPPSFQQAIDHPLTPENTENSIKKKKKKPKKKSGVFGAYSNGEVWPELALEPEPEPEPVPEAWPEAEPEPDPQVEEATVDEEELPYKKKSIWTRHLRDAFSKSAVASHDENLNDAFAPRKNNGSSQDFTPVFLGHAQLYVLADKYGIESLRKLVLSKLYQTLKEFKLYHKSVAGVLEFVRFAYSNTPRHINGIDALRNLATRYIVSVLGQLGENKPFQELLEGGGDFVVDFWLIVWKADNAFNQ